MFKIAKSKKKIAAFLCSCAGPTREIFQHAIFQIRVGLNNDINGCRPPQSQSIASVFCDSPPCIEDERTSAAAKTVFNAR